MSGLLGQKRQVTDNLSSDDENLFSMSSSNRSGPTLNKSKP